MYLKECHSCTSQKALNCLWTSNLSQKLNWKGMEKYLNKKLYCKQVLGVLCDEATQMPINSICVVSTNFNDAIPLRRFDTRWNSSKLNEYQRSFCLSSKVAASLFRAEKSTLDDKNDIVTLFGPISPTPMSKKVTSVQGCSAFLRPKTKS